MNLTKFAKKYGAVVENWTVVAEEAYISYALYPSDEDDNAEPIVLLTKLSSGDYIVRNVWSSYWKKVSYVQEKDIKTYIKRLFKLEKDAGNNDLPN